MQSDPTITAALLRQPYHDCFVNGCDASNLLDNSDTIRSEKDSPQMDDDRGFDVVDKIKSAVEASCPGVVSCADILILGAEASVSLSGGPSWNVTLGRRDSLTAFQAKATTDIPTSSANFTTLVSLFSNKGLNLTDLVALSGGHTIGHSPCTTIKPRLYNYAPQGSPYLNSTYMAKLQKICPRNATKKQIANLDPRSPITFDNSYFKNLLTNEGFLITDQNLYSSSGSPTIDLVKKFSDNQSLFFDHFVYSMNKMGNVNPLTGKNGEIRLNCRKVNNAN
ncbi:Peroxidase 15 [Bienertia sinuspersici]